MNFINPTLLDSVTTATAGIYTLNTQFQTMTEGHHFF